MITQKAHDVLLKLEELFQNPEQLTDTMAKTYIHGEGRPIDRWSWSNRILCWLNGTDDARTFKQWSKVGRSIKRGSKAFYILAPNTRKKVFEEDGEEKEEIVVTGFRGLPVFAYEQTEGDPLPTYEPSKAPPLLDVAEEWGIEIDYQPQMIKNCGGWYSSNKKAITLLSYDESVFFHELMHVADEKASGKLKGGQDLNQEIVAEVGSAVLARIYGFKIDARCYEYMESYSGKPLEAMHSLLPRIEKAMNTIFAVAKETEKQPVFA